MGRTVNLNDTEPVANAGDDAFTHKSPGTGTVPIQNGAADAALGGPVSENVLRSGHVVDRYRIVRLIASGGMARVYEAVHVFTQKSVALKVMHHRLADRKDLIERFRHEAMALSSIRHKNVVNVENAGLTDDGHVFIAMDLLNGNNLRQVFESGKRFELLESLRLVSDVAEGVAAAHEIKVIHRDLKPENIFCVQGGAAKVLDLGTAKFAGDNAPTTQTVLGKVIGTAAYIAPERLEGEPGDERCDVYSLGLVLYECIAGFHPLSPTGKWPSAAEIASRQITYNPRQIPGLPSNIWSLIAKAIQKKPERRFGSMHEFRSAIEVVVAELQMHITVAKRLPSKSRRVGVGLPVIAGIIVGSGSASIVYKLRHSAMIETVSETTTAASVPVIQKETVIPKDITPPAVAPSATVQLTPAAAEVPSASAVADKSNPPLAKAGPTLVPSKLNAKPAGAVGAKPVEVGIGESKPAPPSANKPGVEPAVNSNVGNPKQTKEDLPASGL